MHRYEVRALDARGGYVFGASFWASDNLAAIARFGELPVAAPKAELYRGKRRLVARDSAPELAAEDRYFARSSPGAPQRA